MANKFINPVQMEVAKSIPALQGVDFTGIKPFGTELQDSARASIVAMGKLYDTIKETNEVKSYNDLMAEMDSINMDTTMQINKQLGSDWASTEEGRNAALDIANKNIQKQRDLALNAKGIYGEDKWKNIETYFKRNAYSQVQNLQGQVYQGYTKESVQKFALEKSASVARVGSILGDSALNGQYGIQTEKIYDEMSRQVNLTRSNKLLSPEQQAQSTAEYMGTIIPMMINNELKTKIIDNTQNPAFYTILKDKNGKPQYDEDGNPLYLRDDAGLPIPDVQAKAKDVNDSAKVIVQAIKDGSYVEGLSKSIPGGLTPTEKDFMNSYLKTKGQDIINKSIQQMNIALGAQRKENEEKIMLIDNSANEAGRKAYNGVIDSSKKNNDIMNIYTAVSGTSKTPTQFVSPIINPETGEIAEYSPLRQMTGLSLGELNNTGTSIEGYVTKGQIDKYNKAMESQNPIGDLHTEISKDLQNYKTEDQRDAYYISLASQYNNKLSEKAIKAIAKDPRQRTEGENDMANFVSDTLNYSKLYKFDYSKGVVFNDKKGSDMYLELQANTMSPVVMDSLIKYIGSKAMTPEWGNKYSKLQDAIGAMNSNKRADGTVDANIFTKAIVATMIDDPNFRRDVENKYIPMAQSAILPSRPSYSTYSLSPDQINTLANKARDRAIEEEWTKKSLQYKIPVTKLKEVMGYKSNKIKQEKRSYSQMDSWN